MNVSKQEKVKIKIIEACLDFEMDKETASEISFHMTDWIEDNEKLISMYENIDQFNSDQIQSVLISYLAHVPEHVAAAKKLIGLGNLEDIFQVNILNKD